VAVIRKSEWDYESIASIAKFFRTNNVENLMYLYIPDKFVRKTNLAIRMDDWFETGS
jgi:hypothetical protein